MGRARLATAVDDDGPRKDDEASRAPRMLTTPFSYRHNETSCFNFVASTPGLLMTESLDKIARLLLQKDISRSALHSLPKTTGVGVKSDFRMIGNHRLKKGETLHRQDNPESDILQTTSITARCVEAVGH